uniref:Midnolin n=1 Tax=Anser brachyrhynchus TaxID=132585 RepID=A0A8B9IB71_9AVES
MAGLRSTPGRCRVLGAREVPGAGGAQGVPLAPGGGGGAALLPASYHPARLPSGGGEQLCASLPAAGSSRVGDSGSRGCAGGTASTWGGEGGGRKPLLSFMLCSALPASRILRQRRERCADFLWGWRGAGRCHPLPRCHREVVAGQEVNDFLSGRSPLTLALRVGDHMMFVQLQLAAQQSSGQLQHRHVIASRGEAGAAASPHCRTLHGGAGSGFARIPVVPACQQSPAPSPTPATPAPPVYCNAPHPAPVTAGMFRSHGASTQTVNSSVVSSCSGGCQGARVHSFGVGEQSWVLLVPPGQTLEVAAGPAPCRAGGCGGVLAVLGGQRAWGRGDAWSCVPPEADAASLPACRWTAARAAAPPLAAALPRAPAPANPGPSSRASSTTRLGSSQGPSPVGTGQRWGRQGAAGSHGRGSSRPFCLPPPAGTLHPNCQDSSGRPRRDIGTILQILNDLLSATRHYQGMPQSLAQLRCQTQFSSSSSSSSSPPSSPDLATKTTSEPLPAAAASPPLHPVVQCQSQIRMCKPSGEHGGAPGIWDPRSDPSHPFRGPGWGGPCRARSWPHSPPPHFSPKG